MPAEQETVRKEALDALRSLLKAGLELGVAEAARRLTSATGPHPDQSQKTPLEALLQSDKVQTFLSDAREDASGLLQLIKEVWSRGGPKDRKTAADALGQALNRLAPHRALALARELATMARNSQEAEIVGEQAIAPLLDANPPLFDRVKVFLKDNEAWVRRAATAGLVAYSLRHRKYAAATMEVLLLVGEEKSGEIREGMRKAVKELSRADWQAVAKALAAWAQVDPARWGDVKKYVGAAATEVRSQVDGFVSSKLGRPAGLSARPAKAKPKAAAPKAKRAPSKRPTTKAAKAAPKRAPPSKR